MPLLDGDRHQLGEYMREMADLMGLRDWYLAVSSDPPKSEPIDDTHTVQAECSVNYGRKSAVIAFAANWAEWDTEELRRVVAHELIHCHTEPMRWAINNTRLPLGMTAFLMLEGAFQDAHEVAIDAIACAWAERLPLPVKVDGEQKEAA